MSDTNNPTQETIDQLVANAHGNLTVVRQLLEKYPSIINANASWTETAIQAAAQTGQVEIVNYLLSHGAEYDICTAAMLGSMDCVEEFLKEDSTLVQAHGAHGIPLLYFPIIHGHEALAEFLLQRGADPNAASPAGITPLHATVMFNQPKMASWLLAHGADSDRRYDGKTPLAMAEESKQPDLVAILQGYGGK